MSKAKKASRPFTPSQPKSTPLTAPQGEAAPSLLASLPFAAWCLMLLAAPYCFSGFWPADYQYLPQALFLALTAAVVVLLALSPTTGESGRTKPLLLVSLFLAWCTVTIAGTVYLHDSLLEITRVWGVGAWFFIARTIMQRRRQDDLPLLWPLAAMATGLLLVCVMALLNYVDPNNPRRFDRQFGTFYNPNLFANYIAMALPLTAALALMAIRAARRGASRAMAGAVTTGMVALLGFLVLGLFLTSSKGGLLAALCALAAFVVAVFRAKGTRVQQTLRERRGAVIAVALVVLVLGGGLFMKKIAPRISGKITSDNSTMFRAYTWGGTWRMANARPVQGWGPGSFPSAYPQFATTGYTRTSHELWLQLAAEHGWPATVLLLLACGAAGGCAWRSLRGKNWMAGAGALGTLTAFLVHGLTDAGWGITSIGVLAMTALAISDCGVGIAEEAKEQSEIRNPKSSINWLWLLAALPLASGSWIYQRAQSGEDLRTESRAAMLSTPLTGLEKAGEAVAADSYSARILTNLAQAREAVGQDSLSEFQKTCALQPTRALNYLYLADYLKRHASDEKSAVIGELFDSAVHLDPNDTDIRLARGQWKLERKDESGWEDIEHIAQSQQEPYGQYPATPEMVDLNFATAFSMLAEHDAAKNPAAAKTWIERGSAALALGRKYEPQRQEMEKATTGHVDSSREETMAKLEAEFKSLQGKLK